MVSARLDAVTKAKTAYVTAKATLEARLREQLREELANLQTQIDIAVRYAVDSGETKANVLRALGTKDYGTLNASLERTSKVAEIVGDDPLQDVYSYDPGGRTLSVHYVNHGPSGYTGDAVFDVRFVDSGLIFFSQTPLYSDDFSVRNDAVVALDGKTDGHYYDEANTWVQEQAKQFFEGE